SEYFIGNLRLRVVFAQTQAKVTDKILRRATTRVSEWVAAWDDINHRVFRELSLTLPLPERVVFPDEFLAHRNFMHAVFCERNAHGVADAVLEERADADGRLDAAILPFSGLGDAEMQRIIPIRT